MNENKAERNEIEQNKTVQDKTEQNKKYSARLIELDYKKTNIRAGLIAFAVMLGFCLYGGVNVAVAAAAGLIYFGIKNLKITLPEKANPLWAALEIFLSAIMTEHMVQYLLLDAELREKISVNHTRWNVLCCMVFYLVLLVITAKPKIACMIGHIFLLSLAGINYFVYQFRGNEFSFGDLKAASTGLSVAANYKFVLEDRAVYVILFSMIYVAFIRKLNFEFKKKWMLRISAFAAALVMGIYVGIASEDTVMESWEQKGTYRNGYILNFVLSIRDSFVAEPDGYSKDVVEEISKEYPAPENKGSEDDPTIIVIMNESFADLSVISHYGFETTEEVTPFFDSMDTNVIKGYALSSVFGAKTPDSEWEFLTGNSMAFLPSGSVPYQQYMSKKPYSLVSTLKERGYSCISMHPYYASGWSRSKVYPLLGFDDSLFIDDFDQTNIMREYITDQELYNKIIDQYEAKTSDEKLFILGVTMQNHGGYTDYYDNFQNTINLKNHYFSDVNQYLSLIHESDKALENLITYFENVDDKVEIVFFGDHQPSLNNNFYQSMNGKGLSGLTLDELQELFTVPFFVWTNYDSESKDVELTSLNYLSTMTLQQAGIELPAYNQFLADLQEEIPAMNSRAFYSKSQGEFLHYSDAQGEDADLLNQYNILQYNNMFEKEKDKDKNLFPYYETSD